MEVTTARFDSPSSDNTAEDVDAKLWALSWDAHLCQRSASQRRVYRLLPPAERDHQIAAMLGITIAYAPLNDAVTLWSSDGDE